MDSDKGCQGKDLSAPCCPSLYLSERWHENQGCVSKIMNFSEGDGEPAGTEKETEKGVMGTALQSLHTQEPTRTQSYGYKLGPQPILTTVVFLSEYTIVFSANIRLHELLIKDFKL